MLHSRTTTALAVLLFAIPLVSAQTAQPASDADVKALLAKMEERIKALEAQVDLLTQQVVAKSTAPAAAAPAPGLPPVVTQEPPTQAAGLAAAASIGGASAMAKVLNPDISMIGDFLGAAGHNPVHPTPSLEMHESEVGLQAIIDPYARGDVFLTFGEHGVDVEEAYLTFTSLPGGWRAQVGKMRAAFGKVNTQHNHVLPWTDRPMATDNLVGGEDGIDDAGVSVTRFIPAPKGLFLEGTGQVFRGDSEGIFQHYNRSDLSVVGHVRGYGDLTESTNLEVGASYARGHSELGSQLINTLYGTDVSLRWKPLRRAIYHSFLFRNELFVSRRDLIAGQHRTLGTYSMMEYRLNRRWTVGGRYDYTGRATDPGLDRGASALLTYWPSEFAQIRGQYRFGNYSPSPLNATSLNTNELRFQLIFVMGAHGAHPF